MNAPEDRGDVPDDLLLLMEKEATNSDLVQDYRWMYSIALLRTPVGRVGEDLQEVWWMFHCHSWTPHPMEKKATIADDHDDDVFDGNASGDEYTDYPGDVCYKTTRDQFLLWEYTGIIPQYVELLLNVYLKYAEP